MSTETGIQTKSTQIQAAQKIDEAVNNLIAQSNTLGSFERALMKAEVVDMISTELDKSGKMSSIMAMQGKQYGFRTDSKTATGYSEDVVKACLIEAVIRGVEPTGNMFNILGGNCYITKEGCKHILNRMGISYRIECGLSQKTQSGIYVVPLDIYWNGRLDGKPNKKHIDMPVTVFEGVTKESAREGQAKRDAMAWLIEELTSLPMVVGESSSDESKVFVEAHEIKSESASGVVGVHSHPKPAEPEHEVEGVVVKSAQMAEKKEQSLFDKHISKATDLANLEFRSKQCTLPDGVSQFEAYFDLTVYNEIKSKFEQK